jgi:hypothetical protein
MEKVNGMELHNIRYEKKWMVDKKTGIRYWIYIQKRTRD